MPELWTIGKILKWSAGYLGGRGIDTARLDAEVLLSFVIGKPRIYLYTHFDRPLDKNELASYRDALKRRASREPVAYITGRREFMELSFCVTKDALVPRPDTETLVLAAIELLKGRAGKIADIGTGSGAIALSVLRYVTNITAIAADISEAALRVAKKNAEEFGLSERIDFAEGDLLSPLPREKFEAILSNPPYIPTGVIETLAPEVRAEPRVALDGGEDGLDFYRRLAVGCGDYLKSGGFIAVEVGEGQALTVKDIVERSGSFEKIETIRDLSGIERVVTARKK